MLSYLEQGVLHAKVTDELYEHKQANLTMLVNRSIIAALTIGLLISASVLHAAHPTGWIGRIAVIVLIADSVLIVGLVLGLLKSRRF